MFDIFTAFAGAPEPLLSDNHPVIQLVMHWCTLASASAASSRENLPSKTISQ